MSKSRIRPLGITLGDPAGIGPEVIAKSLRAASIRKIKDLVLIGDQDIFRRYGGRLPGNATFIDLKCVPGGRLAAGKISPAAARASIRTLDFAIELLKRKQLRGLVTGPVCKEAVNLLGLPFHGHTEYLADHFGVRRFGMMFIGERLRTILVTRHIPLSAVSSAINTRNVLESIELVDEALKKMFHIRKPTIGVCGLNPHAGEGGTIGKEEILKILPAIRQARRRGMSVAGPLAGDTAFTPEVAGTFDAIVAMYHDQGLIAIKSLEWTSLVNLTLGLPFIRTSPAHGVAFNIAGKNKANPGSMIEAIRLADRLSR